MKKIFVSTICICMAFLLIFTAISLNEPKNGFVFAHGSETSSLEYLWSQGVIDGYEDGKLHPELFFTRAQFAKILCNTFPCSARVECEVVFSDTDSDHWAWQYIQKAINIGWLMGYDDGTFRPDDIITFEQALTVMCRVLDIYVSDSYPHGYVAAALEYGISDGVNAVIGEEINRAKAADIIVNSLNYVSGLYDDSYSYDTYGNAKYASSSDIGYASVGGGGSMPTATLDLAEERTAEDSGGGGSAGYYPAKSPYIRHSITDGEGYSSEEENVFKNTVTSPLSTFSIDTDTASYSNMRRFVLNGQTIPKGAIRSEELINYFDYQKATSSDGTPFGVNYTVAQCPWNENNSLAMITVSAEELTEQTPSNLVFLIDVSGSMYSYNKLPLVKQALSMLLDKLGENDRVSIVTYASGTRVAMEPTPATEKDKIISVINSLRAGGGTAGASGINLAYELAEKYKTAGNNRVILCTDGDFNIGLSSDGDLEDLISDKRQSGIFLSVLGFGMGNYQDAKMEILADKGNGNYAYIDNVREAKKVLCDHMSKTIYTVAKDVKIQVEFNPVKVSSYRLIGYENRLLNNEDFDDDTKDGGELGAGASVTVLYEIVSADGTEDEKLRYRKTSFTDSDELMTVNIRYKNPKGDDSIFAQYPVDSTLTSNPCEDFRFASAVAELGMILNDSDYRGNATLDSVIDLARSSTGEDFYGLRAEFVQLVDLLRYSMK